MTDSASAPELHAHTTSWPVSREHDVLGVTIGWVDNNGIVRSRTVPTAELPAAVRRGVGVTAVFAVFDSHDGITFAHDGLSTPSGDVRLMPVVDCAAGVVPLAGQPGLAWVPGRQVAADGSPWPYDQRSVLERQVARAAEAGFEVRAGFEVEMVVTREGEDFAPAHRGPAYSANALRDVDEFVRQLLGDLAANGLGIGQLHAEYGESQVELALEPLDAARRLRRPGARPPDHPLRRPGARPADQLRAGHHRGRRRQRLAPAHLAGPRRAQRPHRRRRARPLTRRAAATSPGCCASCPASSP